jgi:hypothetical protein
MLDVDCLPSNIGACMKLKHILTWTSRPERQEKRQEKSTHTQKCSDILFWTSMSRHGLSKRVVHETHTH